MKKILSSLLLFFALIPMGAFAETRVGPENEVGNEATLYSKDADLNEATVCQTFAGNPAWNCHADLWKFDGIAFSEWAYAVRDRSNHTGTQDISTINGLQTKLDELDVQIAELRAQREVAP